MKARIIKLNKNVLNLSEANRRPLIFLISTVLGIGSGVLVQTLSSLSVDSQINGLFENFANVNSTGGFFEIFLGNALYNLAYILIPLFLGLGCVGFAFLYAVPFVKGLGVGSVCAYIYSAYLIKGIGYCALIVFPASSLQFLALILACNESSLMSRDILSVITNGKSDEKNIKMNMYALRYAVIAGFSLLGSLLFTLGNLLFFKIV